MRSPQHPEELVSAEKPEPNNFWQTVISWHSDAGDGGYDWSQGIRAAVAISIPTGVGLITGHLGWGILLALAAFWTLMCDMGGAYRQKALAIAGSGLTLLFAYIFGAWVTQSVLGYILGIFAWAFVMTLVGVAGNAASQAGLISTTIVVVAVVLTAPNEFWTRLLLCTGGILWAGILTLALWPTHPFLPLFQTISKSCSRLADLLDSVWLGSPQSGFGVSNLQVALAYDGLLTSIEQSRKTWGAVRVRRAGPSLRSTQLLDLIENLDSAGKTIVAFRGILNLVGEEPWFNAVRDELHEFTQVLIALGREISAAVARRGAIVDRTRLDAAVDRLLPLLQQSESAAKYDVTRHELRRSVESLAKEFRWLVATSGQLKTGEVSPPRRPQEPPRPRIERFTFFTELRNNLSFQSSTFRHALRLAAASAIAAILASIFHLTRGYWIPMTVVVVLKPNFGGTLHRAVQRISGTVAGALLAALLLWFIQDPWWLLAILALLSFATLTLRWANYVAFSLALTPMIMVMLDLAHPGPPTDSFLRILHTIIGGLLAIVAGYLLFPVWERSKLPSQLAEAYRTTSLFLQALFASGQEKLSVTETRKRSGLAVANAVNAGQRLLSEPPHLRGDVEPLLASINFCRDIFYSLSAIAHLPKDRLAHIRANPVQPVARELAADLDDLAVCLETSQNPKSFPKDFAVENGWTEPVPTDPQHQPSTAGAHDWIPLYLNALVDQVKLAHEAVSRLAEGVRGGTKSSSGQKREVAGPKCESADLHHRFVRSGSTNSHTPCTPCTPRTPRMAMPTSDEQPKPTLSTFQFLIYVSGGFAMNLTNLVLSQWLYERFVIGGIITTAAFSIILLAGRLTDGISDPFIAYWTDISYTRWGRRIPFLALATLPLAVVCFLLWSPPVQAPETVRIIYAAIVCQGYFLLYGLVVTPYLALLPEIGNSPRERLNLTTGQGLATLVGTLVFALSGLIIQQFGYPVLGLVLAVAVLISFYPTAFFIRENTPAERTKGSLLGLFRWIWEVLTNRDFLPLLIGTSLYWYALNLLLMLVPRWVEGQLGLSKEAVTWLMLPFIGANLIGFFFFNWLAKKAGKIISLILVFALSGIVFCLFGWSDRLGLPASPFGCAQIVCGVAGLPVAGFGVLAFALLADVIDADATRTGTRREAIYFGVQAILQKSMIGLSVVSFAQLQAAFGLPGLRWTAAIAGLFCLAGLVAFSRYRLRS